MNTTRTGVVLPIHLLLSKAFGSYCFLRKEIVFTHTRYSFQHKTKAVSNYISSCTGQHKKKEQGTPCVNVLLVYYSYCFCFSFSIDIVFSYCFCFLFFFFLVFFYSFSSMNFTWEPMPWGYYFHFSTNALGVLVYEDTPMNACLHIVCINNISFCRKEILLIHTRHYF